MDKHSANSYIYAKAAGILRKSFIGPRAHLLFEQKSLGDLWTLLFKSPVPDVPEVLLAEKIEHEAMHRFLKQYTSFVDLYDKPDPVYLDQLCIYEAENLKEIAAALINNEHEIPSHINLGKYGKLNYDGWPDIAKITKDSDFAWYNTIPEYSKQQEMEMAIDLQVVRHLSASLHKENHLNYKSLIKIYRHEYVIKNIVWALRLKIYYKYTNEQIISKLIYVTDGPTKDDPVAGPAIKVLDMPLDEYNVWSSWKYSSLLNEHTEGEVWKVDPATIERKNRVRLNGMAYHIFHHYPMTASCLISWYKIKNFELSCIRTAVESLKLNIDSAEAMKIIGLDETGGLING